MIDWHTTARLPTLGDLEALIPDAHVEPVGDRRELVIYTGWKLDDEDEQTLVPLHDEDYARDGTSVAEVRGPKPSTVILADPAPGDVVIGPHGSTVVDDVVDPRAPRSSLWHVEYDIDLGDAAWSEAEVRSAVARRLGFLGSTAKVFPVVALDFEGGVLAELSSLREQRAAQVAREERFAQRAEAADAAVANVKIANVQMVGTSGLLDDEAMISVQSPRPTMSKDQALVHAAWLSVLADPIGDRFAAIKRRVERT